MDYPCQPNPCSGGTCSRSGSTVSCSVCPSGTQLSGNTCVDLCASVNCGVAGSSCSNGQCTCPSGYQPAADKKTCVDRCTVAGAVPCSGPMSMCSRGTCSCGGGNVLRAGGVCESSTDCNSTSFVCVGGQCVLNQTNQRVCRCPPGMKLDAANHCVDIDECKDGTDQCVAPATCVNQFGATYKCSCDDFNKKQGTFLVLKNQFECGQPCQKNCNGVGTCSDGTCTCQSGFVADANVGCRAQCPNDCSGKGTCSETGSCICNDPTVQSIDCSPSGEVPKGPAPPSFGLTSLTSGSAPLPTDSQDSDILETAPSVAQGDGTSPANVELIGGIVGGAVGLLCIIAAVVALTMRAARRRREQQGSTLPPTQPTNSSSTSNNFNAIAVEHAEFSSARAANAQYSSRVIDRPAKYYDQFGPHEI